MIRSIPIKNDKTLEVIGVTEIYPNRVKKKYTSQELKNQQMGSYQFFADQEIAPPLLANGNNHFTIGRMSMTFENFLYSPKISDRRKLEAVRKIFSLIVKLHLLGWKHGDLHGENIMISKNKETGELIVRFIDFAEATRVNQPPYIEKDNKNLKKILIEIDNKRNWNLNLRTIENPTNLINFYLKFFRESWPGLIPPYWKFYRSPGEKLNYYEVIRLLRSKKDSPQNFESAILNKALGATPHEPLSPQKRKDEPLKNISPKLQE